MPEQKTASGPVISAKDAHDIAVDAYIFGYPLLLMDTTRQVMTNVLKAADKAAPLNQFATMRTFPDADFTSVVSPNADTLYSAAFLDLSQAPMVLSVPDTGSRYYMMPMLDGWTNVFDAPGTRTTGNGKGDFAITGPGWSGTLPAGVKEIKSPTEMVWIIGRTQTNGPSDYAAVNALQDKYRLTPLGSFGKSYTPPDNVPLDSHIDVKTAPDAQVARMDAATFFSRLNALMKNNPPAPADAEAIARFAKIGVAPGKAFRLEDLDPAVAKQVVGSVRDAQAKIIAEGKKSHGKNLNGWDFMYGLGQYHTNYLFRAVVALVGLGANLAEDAIYPRATVDTNGQPLNGSNQYEIHFAKGSLPPVGAFWSITLYNDKQFFVANPINRYAIGDRDKLQFASDGSLTLYVQNASPGKDKESNWLPAPTDSFNLFMRLYWPKKEIIDGAWTPPRVEPKRAESKKIA